MGITYGDKIALVVILITTYILMPLFLKAIAPPLFLIILTSKLFSIAWTIIFIIFGIHLVLPMIFKREL